MLLQEIKTLYSNIDELKSANINYKEWTSALEKEEEKLEEDLNVEKFRNKELCNNKRADEEKIGSLIKTLDSERKELNEAR